MPANPVGDAKTAPDIILNIRAKHILMMMLILMSGGVTMIAEVIVLLYFSRYVDTRVVIKMVFDYVLIAASSI